MNSVTKNKNPLVSIVILTWNSANFIETCLESLSWQTYRPFEVIVADNASKDGTLKKAKECPQCGIVKKFLANERNLGCAGGNNVGWRASSGEIVVILNPDTVVEKTWLEELAGALQSDPEAAVAGCKIYYPNSHILQHAGGKIHPNGMTTHLGNGEEDKGQYDELRTVDYVTGAALAVKRKILEEIGGFDEDYDPAYFEETDFCYKVRKKGCKVIYVPKSVLYHYESPGLTKNSPRFYEMYYKMRFRFVLKNFSVKDLLFRFLPFELKWMLFEPAARGFRLMQLRAYLHGLKFVLFQRR